MANFRTRARAVDLLGKQQIRDEVTAISELLRNSYDADASEGLIDVDTLNNRIVVWDDGDGMSEEDILNNWLTLGTYSKKSKTIIRTAKGRIKIGEKGIGRLAISTLGDQLLLVSKKKTSNNNSSHWAVMYLHWELFRNENIYLEDIEIPVQTFSDFDTLIDFLKNNLGKLKKVLLSNFSKTNKWSITTLEKVSQEIKEFNINDDLVSQLRINELHGSGTLFYIKNLESTWDWSIYSAQIDDQSLIRRKQRLKDILFSFQNIIDLYESGSTLDDGNNQNAFKPRIHIDESKLENETFLNPEEIKLYDYALKGLIDNGEFKGEAFIGAADKGEPVHVAKDRLTHGLHLNSFNDCGPIEIKWFFLEGNPSSSSVPKEKHEIILEKLKTIGGIFVYRDGLRILPYGEPGNDFLEMEERRTKHAGKYLFSHRRMFGYMEISKQGNPYLIDKSSREGFVENGQFNYFKAVAINLLLWWAQDFLESMEETGRRGTFIKHLKDERKVEENLKLQQENEAINEREYFKGLEKNLKLFEQKFAQTEKRIQNGLEQLFTNTKKDIKSVIDNDLNFQEYLFNVRRDAFRIIEELEALKSHVNLRYHHSAEYLELIERNNDSLKKSKTDFHAIVENKLSELRDQHILSITDEKNSKKELLRHLDNLTSCVGNSVSNNISEIERQVISELEESVSQVLSDAPQFLFHDIKDFRERIEQKQEELFCRIIRLKQMADHLIVSEPGYLRDVSNITHQADEIEQEILRIQDDMMQYADNLQSSVKYRYLKRTFSDIHQKFSQDVPLFLDEEFIGFLKKEVNLYRELSAIGLAAELISHEFNGLYSNIRGSLSTLRKNFKETNSEPILERIQLSFTSLERLHQRMSPLYRQSRYRRKDIILREFIENALEYFSSDIGKYGICVWNHIPERLMVKELDAALFTPIANLISNSIYWLLNQEQKELHFYIGEDKRTFYVHDTGPGIKERDRNRIFEPFFSRRVDGRGLGLFLSKDILQSRGHQLFLVPIGAEPRPIKGACFCIEFKEAFDD